MSDDLILSGGGATTVASDELLEHARRLRSLSERLSNWHVSIARLAASEAPLSGSDWMTRDIETCLIEARTALARATDVADGLSTGLLDAAERYGLAERGVTGVLQHWSAHFAFVIGRLAPFILLTQPALLGGIGGALLAAALVARTMPQAMPALDAELSRRKAVLSNPLFIQAVRYAASSVDDGVLGVLGAPWLLNHALGDEGLGVLGVRSSAYLATRLAPGAMLAETPVTVQRVSSSTVTAPTSVRQLAERIPVMTENGAQMRIERYPRDDAAKNTKNVQSSWIVYIGGTVDAAVIPTGEPWDMTSNVNGIAGVDSGSYEATVQAMRKAGIQPDDPLIMVGHSQGGIVATRIAASGEFGAQELGAEEFDSMRRPTGLLTFGSPTGQMPVPDSVLAVGVEHMDDLIPALGGVASGSSGAESERLLIRRMVYNDQPLPADELLPAHSMENYRHTAELMDASSDDRIGAFTNLIHSVAANAPAAGVATVWRGARVQPSILPGRAMTLPR